MSLADQADRLLMDNKQAAHSPGPWTLDPIAGAAGNYYIYSDADHGALIAKVDCRECGADQAASNAALVSAAPDLAEALVNMDLSCQNDVLNPCWDGRPTDVAGKHWGGGTACANCRGRAALAKAGLL